MSRTKMVLAGEGGQGVQSVAKILVEAGYEAGKQVLYIPNFGVEQRGGVSIAFCQIADEKIGEPRFAKGDIVIMLSDRAIDRCATYVDKNSVVVYDTSVCSKKPDVECKEIIGVDANKIANEQLSARVFNIIFTPNYQNEVFPGIRTGMTDDEIQSILAHYKKIGRDEQKC